MVNEKILCKITLHGDKWGNDYINGVGARVLCFIHDMQFFIPKCHNVQMEYGDDVLYIF
jgi:hypothetical protein